MTESAVFKAIKTQEDVEKFKASATFRKIKTYVDACCNAVKGLPRRQRSSRAGASSPSDPLVVAMEQELFLPIVKAVDEIPLHDMRTQRFGNKAFRDFHRWLEEHQHDIVGKIVEAVSPLAAHRSNLVMELCGYLLDSFGNPIRMDYGTGHELHFFMFVIICLECLNVMSLPEPEQALVLRDSVFSIFWEYMNVMRKIQKRYSLEPAGSHGVWGLDDYHHLPFIFGAAQLCGHEAAEAGGAMPILPKHVTEPHHVKENRELYLYFECIAWIRENKTGPFHEHSSMLYNISGIDDWGRIAAGMIKMYDAEVLGKYNVIQHLLFGKHFPFE